MSKATLPLTEDHLWEIVDDNREFQLYGQLDMDRIIHYAVQGGPGVALVQDGVTIAALGGSVLWNGVAGVWALVSLESSQHKLWLHKTALQLIDAAFNEYGIHRLHAEVRRNWLEGCKWAESLGFVVEGIMHRYGADGSDYVRYAQWR